MTRATPRRCSAASSGLQSRQLPTWRNRSSISASSMRPSAARAAAVRRKSAEVTKAHDVLERVDSGLPLRARTAREVNPASSGLAPTATGRLRRLGGLRDESSAARVYFINIIREYIYGVGMPLA